MISLPDGFQFREMNLADKSAALDLIQRHNHDDFEEAKKSYDKTINGQFVLTHNHDLIGVTGARAIPGTQKSFWLSWTYLDPAAAMSMGDPNLLFELICDQLIKRGEARVLFAMISPSVDSALGGGHAYGGALESYRQFGFQEELTQQGYYTPNESMTLLSYRLNPMRSPKTWPVDRRQLAILDSDEIAETDDAYYLEWQLVEDEPGPEEQFPHWRNQITDWEGRVVFVGLPAHAETAIEQCLSVGFRQDGRITDFYEDGLDEVRLRFDL